MRMVWPEKTVEQLALRDLLEGLGHKVCLFDGNVERVDPEGNDGWGYRWRRVTVRRSTDKDWRDYLTANVGETIDLNFERGSV